jgi:hypothetical protein
VCLTPVIRKTEPHKKSLDFYRQLSSGSEILHLIGWNIGGLYKRFGAAGTADYLFEWHAPLILHKYKQTPIFSS